MSGGFPHSEISGSKPIPGSPKLNAGYHVLHRLLLPRHPPNALFALDLTRKEQGRWFKWPASLRRQKSYTYPCVQRTRPEAQSPHTVSVLDLEQYHLSGSNPRQPLLGLPDDTDVSHSKRCQFRRPSSLRATWPSSFTGRSNASEDALDDHVKSAKRNGGSRRT
jgi:hypothetical protein